MEIPIFCVPLHPRSTKTHKTEQIGAVVQLVRIPACHAGGRGFESRPHRQREHSSVGLEHLPYKQRVGGSTPSAPTNENAFLRCREAFFISPPGSGQGASKAYLQFTCNFSARNPNHINNFYYLNTACTRRKCRFLLYAILYLPYVIYIIAL